jgi:mobilome CxxCx(11)CxxC protein
MLTHATLDKIQQHKLNALVAIELHKVKIRKLQRINRIVDALSVMVPACYITPRFLAKGTSLATVIDIVGEILAVILLGVVIFKLVNKWQEDEISHKNMVQKNSETVFNADQLLDSPTATSEVVAQFLRRVKEVDDEDKALLLETQNIDKQKAYREALKTFRASRSTPCPSCGADPWKYTPGTCQVCGGTPV